MFDDSQVRAFKRDFGFFVPTKYKTLGLGDKKHLLEITVDLFHKDWRRDADVAILLDCLQTAGVVSNDRWFRRIIVNALTVDAVNPRAEIEIKEI